MKKNEESVQAKGTKPKRLSNRQLEAAYACGGDWAMHSAVKASFRAKPCPNPQTEKEKQRLVRWMVLQKFFGRYAAVQIAVANGLLKQPVEANLESGIAAAEEHNLNPNTLLKDAVKLVKSRWWFVNHVVEAIKADPRLRPDSKSGGLRLNILWT